MFKSIKSVIYPSSNLDKDKKFWTDALGTTPYFDQPYYVGFTVEGCELGLDPNAHSEGMPYPIAYWHVDDVEETSKKLQESGAAILKEIKDVGDGTLMGTFKDKSGNIFGIISLQK